MIHSIQSAARVGTKIRSGSVPEYFRLIRASKHDKCPPCYPPPKEELIKCPDSHLCGKHLKKKRFRRAPPKKLDPKEELDNPDCPWCRRK